MEEFEFEPRFPRIPKSNLFSPILCHLFLALVINQYISRPYSSQQGRKNYFEKAIGSLHCHSRKEIDPDHVGYEKLKSLYTKGPHYLISASVSSFSSFYACA